MTKNDKLEPLRTGNDIKPLGFYGATPESEGLSVEEFNERVTYIRECLVKWDEFKKKHHFVQRENIIGWLPNNG